MFRFSPFSWHPTSCAGFFSLTPKALSYNTFSWRSEYMIRAFNQGVFQPQSGMDTPAGEERARDRVIRAGVSGLKVVNLTQAILYQK
jgi:hypothetical protein